MSIYQILGVEPKYPPEMISSETNGSGEIEPMGIYDVLGVEPSEENQEIRAKILETANKEGKELAKEVVAEIRMLRSLDVKKYTLLLKYEELKNHLARDPDYEDKVRRTIEKTMNFEDVKACIEQDERKSVV